RVLWILKVLSYDLLERHGTKEALPLLKRMASDPTGYQSLQTAEDKVTRLPEATKTETIRFADRVQKLIETLSK
ncbi:MAG: hypothetical protein AAF517_25850, partial [Planctomycetota bacterium]